MPETLPEAARLSELLEIVQEGGRRLPWSLWTSCSFRRIKTGHLMGDRGDGKDVLSGSICHDGVADLSMPEHQLEALVEIMNLLPALASLQPSVSEMRPNEEVERWALAYEMAHEQAMSNGISAARYKAALERLLGGDLDVSGTALILSNSSAEAREIIASARSALSPEGEP